MCKYTCSTGVYLKGEAIISPLQELLSLLEELLPPLEELLLSPLSPSYTTKLHLIKDKQYLSEWVAVQELKKTDKSITLLGVFHPLLHLQTPIFSPSTFAVLHFIQPSSSS